MLTPFWLFGFALSALWYKKTSRYCTRFLRGSLLVVDRPRRARARAPELGTASSFTSKRVHGTRLVHAH